MLLSCNNPSPWLKGEWKARPSGLQGWSDYIQTVEGIATILTILQTEPKKNLTNRFHYIYPMRQGIVDICSKIYWWLHISACAVPATQVGIALDSRAARGGVMFYNRFQSELPAFPVANPSPSPAAFFLCPLMGLPFASTAQCQWQQDLYAWALAQAQAVVRPSLPERDLLGVWN